MNCFPIFVIFFIFFGNTFTNGQVQTQVWLTVSSLADKHSQRNIEIHWRNAPKSNLNDWVGLFTKDPTDSSGAIEKIQIDSKINGYNKTNVQFPYQNFPTSKLTQECLGYYVAYIHNGVVIAKNCIKNNPFWMENSLSNIGNKTLTDIMIPGTHDAGSYEKYGPKSEDLIRKFQMTQDESLYNQMVYGIRYVDMRVGYHNVSGSEEKLWIVHGPLIDNLTLRSAAQQVKDFLKVAPKEIVIFDFHGFEDGFNQEKDVELLKKRYKEFFEIVSNQLQDFMIPYSLGYGVTINELIHKNKRVLVGFEAKLNKYIESDLLWPNVKHQWGDKDEIEPLIKYFENTLCSDNKHLLRSAMAEMTPTTQGVLSSKYESLRALAQVTNSKYMEWFNDRWANCVNIVAADYFLGSNVVDIAISVNHRRNIKLKQSKFFNQIF